MINSINSYVHCKITIRILGSSCMMACIILMSAVEILMPLLPIKTSLPAGYHIDLIKATMYSDMVLSFIPIIAVLPISASYIDSLKTKFVQFVCVRSSRREYIQTQTIVCIICGGLVILAGVLISWVVLAVILCSFEKTGENTLEAKAEVIDICWLLFCTGSLWAVVGMSISAFMESKYIAYSIPFILYYLLVILYERYFSDLFIIYPKTWTDPAAWPFGCWGAAIFLLEMTLIFAILFAFRAGRRLQQL